MVAASSTPMKMLKLRKARSDFSTRCMAAPKPSQTIMHGMPATTKIAANSAACGSALGASACRKLPTAPAQISQAFGLTHWNAAAPKKPIGRSRSAGCRSAGGGDLPGEPEQHDDPDDAENAHRVGIGEQGRSRAGGDEEEHQREAERDAEHMRQSAADADIGAGRRQHDVVRPRRDRGHHRENGKGDELVRSSSARRN